MIKGIHHISMKCGTAKVKAAGYELFIEPNNKDIPSNPPYPDSADKFFAMLPHKNGGDTTKHLIF